MWIKEKLKNIMESPDDEDYEDDSGEENENEYADSYAPVNGSGTDGKKPDGRTPKKQCGKIVNINTTAKLKVYVVKPEQLGDAIGIADLLKSTRTIVLNLENTNRDTSHRILDFIAGVAYAYNGQIKRIANNTFLIAPYNVELMGNLLEDFESGDWDIYDSGEYDKDNL